MFRSRVRSLGGVLVLSLLLLIAFACGGDSETAEAPQGQSSTQATEAAQTTDTTQAAEMTTPVEVVTTSNIVADWVRNVGQDRVNVFALLPPNADPHTFQPGARDVASVADADVVFSIGLGLEEGWFTELLENAAADESSLIELAEAEDIQAIEFVDLHMDAHAGESELIAGLEHAIHEVEDGHITAAAGLKEISELVEAIEAMEHADEHEDEHEHEDEDEHEHEDEDEHEHEDEDEHDHEHEHEHEHEDEHGHEDEHAHEHELIEKILELIASVDAGQMDAEAAMEAIDVLVHDSEAMEHADEHDHEDEDEHGHAHGSHDPHFWFDPIRVKVAVNNIAAKLSELDPEGSATYQANAAAYNQELDSLHAWIEQEVAKVPVDHRKLVTNHDAFQYFAARYGFEVVGAIIPSVTTEAEATPQELAHLIETIEHEGVTAVFGETIHSDRMARQIADETGAKLVGTLYTGSLSEAGGEAGNYLDYMRFNVTTIVNALQ